MFHFWLASLWRDHHHGGTAHGRIDKLASDYRCRSSTLCVGESAALESTVATSVSLERHRH
jgi:hypothetical protein